MTDITVTYNPLQSLGYVTCNVPPDVLDKVNQEVQGLLANNFKFAKPYNDQLAGLIEKEFGLVQCKDDLNKFFKVVIPEYWRLQGNKDQMNINYRIHNRDNTNIPDLWVNLQQKNEYNPMHDHRGVLSFVLYLNIPYDMEKEHSLPHVKNSQSTSFSSFSFIFPRVTSQYIRTDSNPISQYVISIDKSWEGKMIIFPSWLSHEVTPFHTSDDYRISVAGNLTPVKYG